MPGDQRQGTLVPFTILCLSNIFMKSCRWQTRNDDLLPSRPTSPSPTGARHPHLQVFHPSELLKPWLKVLLEAILQLTENAGTCPMVSAHGPRDRTLNSFVVIDLSMWSSTTLQKLPLNSALQDRECPYQDEGR